MKRFLGVFLSMCLVLSCTIPCYAASADTDSFVINGVRYTTTVEVYKQGDENEYSIIEVASTDGITAVWDTRNDYVVENGEKIHFSRHDTNISPYASRPTAIEHGQTIGKGWTYSYSSWSEYTFEKTLNAISINVVAAVLGNALGGGWGATLALAIATAFVDASPTKAEGFWVRTYFYGCNNMVSVFAYVKQAYTEDYVAVPESCVKHNPQPTTPF